MELKTLQIMKTRPTASDEEIKGYMNFDAVLKQHVAKKAAQQKLIRTGLLLTGALCVGIVAYWMISGNGSTPETGAVPTSESVSPTPTTEARTSDSTAVAKPIVAETPSLGEQQESKKKEVTSAKKQTEAITNEEPKLVYSEAEPETGYPLLYEYFHRELNYPAEALKDSIQGVVSVQFIINPNGKPEKITIQNSLGAAFDQEAIRLIEQMPAWKPAQLNGKPIASRLSIPITFQLSHSKAPQP